MAYEGYYHWGVLPLDCLRKRFSGFYRFKRFKGVGAAHKNIEVPQSMDVAMPEGFLKSRFPV